MHRKYSEVVNFVPNFNNDYRQRSREPTNNQKLSPVELTRPSYSPNLYPQSQFQSFGKQHHVPRDTPHIPSSSFHVGERQSMPNFNTRPNLIQTLESPLLDPRHPTANGFKHTGLITQPLSNCRVDHFNVSSDSPQQFNSPQNFGRPILIDYSQTSENLMKNIQTTHTSPVKFEPYKIQQKQISSPYHNPPRLPNNPSPVNLNNIRQNGRVCQSMIFPDVSTEKPEENRQLFSGLNHQYNLVASNPNISDLESTFSSDIHSSSTDLANSGEGIKCVKMEARKKEEVWRSAELTIKNSPTQNNTNLKFSSIFNFNPGLTREKDGHSNNLKDKRTSIKLEDVGIIPKTKKTHDFTPEISPSEFQFRKKNEPSMLMKEGESIETSRSFTIDDFETIEKLGRGTYGDVFLVRERKSRFVCVLKALSKKRIKELKLEEHVFREIKIQSYLNHKHITTLYGVFHDENKIYLIMECMADGSMASNGKKKIGESEVAHLISQVCEGLLYMHREDIIHRDIKPENLLLSNNYLKIGDFGCAVFGNTLRRTVVGCYAYISPEQFSNNPYDQKIDSWSVGILAYEMLTGKPPYEEQLRKIAMESSKEDRSMNTASMMDFPEIEFPSDCNISADAIDFIQRLLDKDPVRRAELKEALKHKFLGKAKEYEKYLESKL